MQISNPLWEASQARKETSQISRFAQTVSDKTGLNLKDWSSLYSWSIRETKDFWRELSDFVGVQWICRGSHTYTPPPPNRMLGAQWFQGSTLNYAKNLLEVNPLKSQVLVSVRESSCREDFNQNQLKEKVHVLAQYLRSQGVQKGDPVCAVITNTSEALIGMLATAAIGAVWSSCSPDFGIRGVLDRFQQVEPKFLFFSLGYEYQGKFFNLTEGFREIVKNLESLRGAVTISPPNLGLSVSGYKAWEDLLTHPAPVENFYYEPTEFNHPLFIVFSSGTTGLPKCILHGVGRVLLQHKKELILHTDMTPADRLFYYTTTGWMMWNWMASALSTGGSLLTYEGSPGFPDLSRLWKLVEEEGVSIFGTSPKFIASCMKAGISPKQFMDTSGLRTILSTGAPLLPDHFDWIYEHVSHDVHLASISGGTDILSCFMLGNPLLPVYPGEIQGPGLGMDIRALDDAGQVTYMQKGELVCAAPFVSMPLGFLNDPDQKKYRSAYFEHYPEKDIWRHGDFVSMGQNHQGIVVFGRSDATLNPGGIRIGTAELYLQLESMPEVLDSLAISVPNGDGDVDILLFVMLAEGTSFDGDLNQRIRAQIKKNLTPRHVPRFIWPVKGIPYTKSGKKVEITISLLMQGIAPNNITALMNPEVLEEYEKIRKAWIASLKV